MRRILFFLLTAFFVAAASAAALSPAAKTEIDGLMSRLEASACEFNRNGSWHTAPQAKAHLLNKLQYFEERGAVNSAEQFIELAASKSSITGKAYLVKCSGGQPVPSSAWLLSQLQLMRSAASARKTP